MICAAATRCCSHSRCGLGANTGLADDLSQWNPSTLFAYPIALGSYCSPAEYHIFQSFAELSHITCGHMTATFSQAALGSSTGVADWRTQLRPSALFA